MHKLLQTTARSFAGSQTHGAWEQPCQHLAPEHSPGVIGIKVFVAGGTSNAGIVNVHEIDDTANNSWSQGARLPTPRQGGPSAVVNNIFYAIGGANNGQLSVVEAYDPAASA
jgi:hypothetical protein